MNAVKYLPQLKEELERVQEFIEFQSSSDKYEDPMANQQDDQEEWMLLSQLNPTFENKGNESDIDDAVWETSITSLTPEQITESANWISTIRKNYDHTQSFQSYSTSSVDINTLNDEQSLAFDIITKHHQISINQGPGIQKQLLMIIYGTAGTGK